MRCPDCNREVGNVNSCPYCGADVSNQIQDTKDTINAIPIEDNKKGKYNIFAGIIALLSAFVAINLVEKLFYIQISAIGMNALIAYPTVSKSKILFAVIIEIISTIVYILVDRRSYQSKRKAFLLTSILVMVFSYIILYLLNFEKLFISNAEYLPFEILEYRIGLSVFYSSEVSFLLGAFYIVLRGRRQIIALIKCILIGVLDLLLCAVALTGFFLAMIVTRFVWIGVAIVPLAVFLLSLFIFAEKE